MKKNIFRLILIAALLLFTIYLVIPLFSITELIYPVKMDSVFLHAQQMQYEKELSEGKAKPGKIFLYNPLQLNLISENFSIRTPDSITLKGWYVTDSTVNSGITLILIPDLKESKLNYIEAASEFLARGIHVCLVDMRAQGESEGAFYTMGKITIQDLSIIIDSLISKYKTENIAVMGNNTGAAIALQGGDFEERIKVLVLQNPFLSLDDYLATYAVEKYGKFSKLFYKRLRKDFEREIGFSADSLNLSGLVKEVELPTLFISYLSENHLDYQSSEKLFNASAASKKEWIIYREFEEEKKRWEENKIYYDKIAAFVNSNIPKKKKQSKFKRLVFN